jgi:hypothetical protein
VGVTYFMWWNIIVGQGLMFIIVGAFVLRS